jgi:hypothetical protein
VGVEIAGDVLQLDEAGQRPLPRGGQLAAILAQLGRDPLIAEELVELLLVGRGEDLARLRVLDAVLGHGQLPADCLLPEGDVMRLRAGEVLQQVPVALGRDDAEVEPQAVVRDDRRFRRSAGDDLGHPRERGEMGGERRRIARGGDDVEVAHGLAATAHAARLGDPLGRRVLAELGDRALDGGQDLAEEHASTFGLTRLRLRERLEDLLFGLRPQSGQPGEQTLLGRGTKVGGGLNPELGMELLRGLGPEPGDVHHLDEARGKLLAQLRDCGQIAGLGVLEDLVLDGRADARELRRAPFLGELSHGHGRLPDPRRRPAVSGEPERVGAVQLQHVGEQLELLGELCVRGQWAGHAAMIRGCGSSSACRHTTSARTSSRWCTRSTRFCSDTISTPACS